MSTEKLRQKIAELETFEKCRNIIKERIKKAEERGENKIKVPDHDPCARGYRYLTDFGYQVVADKDWDYFWLTWGSG